MELVFSHGLYLANLAVSSNILIDSWNAISEHQGDNPGAIIKRHPDYNIIAFVSLPVTGYLQEKVGSVHISEIADFQFLRSNIPPSPFKTEAAFSRFNSLQKEFPRLQNLVQTSFKSEDSNSSANQNTEKDNIPCIITGCCLDGSIASLFTLSLLKTPGSNQNKLPICITFGSPLLGDDAFQQAVSSYLTWNSRFLHVVHKDERRLFLVHPTTGQSPYKPFGTFLLYSESGCACFQAPESVIELLKYESRGNQESQTFDYKNVIKCIEKIRYRMNGSLFPGRKADSYEAGINTQVAAIGLWQSQQQNEGISASIEQQNEDISALIEKIVEHEENVIKREREEFDPAKELNEMKVYMALFEWYIEKCRADGQGPGYYDSFKNARERRDNGVDKYKTYLTDYWEKVIDDAANKPQIWRAKLRPRLLFAGKNYQKIVEPLDIAEYYRRGRKDYLTRGRSDHYKLLQQWLQDHQNSENARKKGKETEDGHSKSEVVNVTEDPCFWARVEDAIRSCRLLDIARAGSSHDSVGKKPFDFEKYVMDLIKENKVSSDIFLEKSSYMQWWREYREFLNKKVEKGSHAPDSELVNYMKEDYKKYGKGSPTDSNESTSDTLHSGPLTSGDHRGSQLVS